MLIFQYLDMLKVIVHSHSSITNSALNIPSVNFSSMFVEVFMVIARTIKRKERLTILRYDFLDKSLLHSFMTMLLSGHVCTFLLVHIPIMGICDMEYSHRFLLLYGRYLVITIIIISQGLRICSFIITDKTTAVAEG